MTYSCNNYETASYGGVPLSPFRKAASNPVLAPRLDDSVPVLSTGHGSVVASPVHGLGAQDVTLQTPRDAELLYVHHGRNSTARARSLYTTRMTLQEGPDDAIRMATPRDQELPRDTFPLVLEITCERRDGQSGVYKVQVRARFGAPFDLREGSNRVVGVPGAVWPTKWWTGKKMGSLSMYLGTV